MIALAAQGRRPMVSPKRFAPFHRWDHNFFLLYVVLIWTGVCMGFGGDIIRHVQEHRPPYPLIVHVHAAAMVSWLVLLTTQVLLIRADRRDLHRRLGLAGMALAAVIVVLGPVTAITVHGLEFGTADSDAPFLSIQLSDILAFAVLAGSGILLRAHPSAHKRLMLLATLYISDAGFARWLGGPVHGWLGDGYWPSLTGLYIGNDLLIVGLGVYDFVTRRRLHPAYMAAVPFIFGLQMTAVWLHLSPWWKPISLRLIGH